MMHEVQQFVMRIPFTYCGIYVDNDKATAIPALVECKNCKRARVWG